MPNDIEQVTAAVAATIRTIAGQGSMGEGELHALADQVTADWDGVCCPVCEEVLCDDGCPLAGVRAARRHADQAVRHNDRSTMETDQAGEPQRVEVTVLITVGDQAELATPQHPAGAALRMPAAIIAEDAGLPENELPGRDFTAIQDGDELRDFRLVDDPRL